MMKYTDMNGYDCWLSFEKGALPIESRHVLVISKFKGMWLLTDHKKRGLEFPGGKAETGERLIDAAKREVYEETGAVVETLQWFAEYQVHSEKPFCKTVFVGKVSKIDEIGLMETNGAVLMDELEIDSRFSFLMKDQGMLEMIKQVNLDGKWND